MKQTFNNVGIAQVQAQLLALPQSDREAELQSLRHDFAAWMSAHFELTASEQDQLAELPAAFRQDIADGLADVLENGGTVSFFKTPREERDGKDILLRSSRVQRYSFDREKLEAVPECSLWIT